MKIEEVRSKTDTELAYDLDKMRKELFDLRFKSAVDNSANTAMISQFHRSPARVPPTLPQRPHGLPGPAPQSTR